MPGEKEKKRGVLAIEASSGKDIQRSPRITPTYIRLASPRETSPKGNATN
jgi:hypothetical protein